MEIWRDSKLAKKLRYFQWLIYASGGIGTLLAAMGFELWIALTTALAGSFTTYLQFKQTEATLINHNQTAADLSNIKDWWIALSVDEQNKSINLDRLVAFTENTSKQEHVGWVQQMQDMLDELKEEQSTTKEESTI